MFDLDGTLTDPRPGITRSIRFALERLLISCPSEDVLASFIGPPLRGTFASLLDTSDREKIEEAMSLYRQRYSDIGLYENEVYEGTPEMLRRMKKEMGKLFVVTSKPTIYAESIVKHFKLDSYFSGIYGAELDGNYENKTELIAHLLIKENVLKGASIMIGDRAVDIIAAKSNGLASIGVLWGYGSQEELLGAGADLLCARPAELLSAVLQR
jgi:phosphoglycolate phosphatase